MTAQRTQGHREQTHGHYPAKDLVHYFLLGDRLPVTHEGKGKMLLVSGSYMRRVILTAGLRVTRGVADPQQASCSREIFNPLRFPSAVTAIESVRKKSFAISCRSSEVTASIFWIKASMP